MAATAELEKTLIDLSDEAFNVFVEDIATMFDVGTNGKQIEAANTTAADLKKKYRQKCAIWSVTGKGIVNGECYLLAKSEGVFTLAGTFVMQPEQIILQNRTRGDASAMQDLKDAIGEVGNLMVGSWDRAFRENSKEHIHFKQSGTILNDPWQELKSRGLDEKEAAFAITYEMKVEPFDAFECVVFYPNNCLVTGQPQPAPTPVAAQPQPIEIKTQQPEPPKPAAPQTQEPQKQEAAKQDLPKPIPKENVAEQKAEPKPEAKPTPEPAVEIEPSSQNLNQTLPAEENKEHPVTKAIQELIKQQSYPANDIKALNLLKKDVVWATQDDTVEKVMNLLQQKGAEYILIGNGTTLEGLISNSDIQAALSPYLKPIFSKWKRPLDTATLQIKAKWVMSRPVHTVTPEADFNNIREKILKNRINCLPVVDGTGKVLGIITIFDVLAAL